MSAKTKIVVLHMKELIYTGIFAALGILFIVLMIVMFLPGRKEEPQDGSAPGGTEEGISSVSASGSVYIPGIYTTELVLGSQSVEIEVIVEESSIESIRMADPDESLTTMYPLLEPTFDSICEQIYENQSLDEISYTSDNKYTSLVLMEAIQASLDKASLDASSSEGSF
ncbi:hypothetical protein [Candidatus Acetatifactor stercoripullorum]|uniref:hypothetical protein n=1 Tax=Candidatus Acetatifactor stercoripullorum TaxID=2838414 RepID=UPI00298DEC3F|nr:hypothetical protein [Candidatus Acetatifactor stercoripullorum]